MTKITITQAANAETGAAKTGANAIIQFDDGPRHPVTVQDPFTEAQEKELRWYFEKWLTFPFTGHVRAGKAAATVQDYGEQLFEQLFGGRKVYAQYNKAVSKGIGGLSFEIRGTPAFHGLHWEALKDPDRNRPFAVECSFLRQNDNPPPNDLDSQPSPTLNILLVSARPGGRQDVGYRTISRPLVETLRNSKLRTQIDIVRPGTYAALVDHLQQSRSQQGDGYYHLIHFDVHGSLLPYDAYQKLDADYSAAPFQYKGYAQDEIAPYDGLKAFLAFNGPEPGKPDLVADTEIGGLLQRHQIPIAILNACQSGMQVGESETSLGSRLMAEGVQIALAMGYSVTVSAAELLMKTLYAQLLSGQSVHEAIRRARLGLLNQKERRAAYNQRIPLEDWLLPVVYQNRTVALPLTEFPSVAAEEAYRQKQASRYQAPTPTYGFFGRDVDILEIETRLLAGEAEASNLLLVQGMGGAGKTTLLRHLMEWWQTTRLVDHVFYFGYDEKAYTSAQIIDGIARDLYGAAYGSAFSPFSDEVKAQKLAEKLRAERHLLVLDNLESITGAALSIQHTLDGVEQGRLREFLAMLRGGRTLVLLGSRGKEEWLVGTQVGAQRAAPLQVHIYELPGLDPEAASALADGILRRLGKTHYASDAQYLADFQQLMKLLDGYPLALEIVLANLARQTPAELLTAFTAGAEIEPAASGELWENKTKSILRCVEYSHSNLSPDAQALLACLAPFTGVVNTEWLPQYTAQLEEQPALAHLPFEQWQPVLQEAMNWGLLTPHEMGGGYLRMQPIFPYFLRQRFNDPVQADFQEAINTAFRAHYDGIGGYLAQRIESKAAQERQLGLALTNLEYENLMTALKLALQQHTTFDNLYQNLAEYLRQQQASYEEKAICEIILAEQLQYPQELIQGKIGGEFFVVLGNKGALNLNLKLYEEAETAFQNAVQLIPQLIAYTEKQRGLWTATTYQQLGMVAQAQREWETAVSHYNNALKIFIDFNDRYTQASTYHQLGVVAAEQRQWETAVSHYNNALQIKIDFNDRYAQASTYHQLGRVAEEQRQWETAVSHYNNALQICIDFNDRYAQAGTYHQLGMVAQEQRDWETAVSHYHNALQIKIDFNDRYAQAGTYHQLGMVAQEQREWETAVSHYNNALQIYIDFNDRYAQAGTYHQLGRVAEEQRDWETAVSHYNNALQIDNEFNNRYGQASTYHQLGRVAEEQRDWETAVSHYNNALQIYIDFNDRYEQADVYHQLGRVAQEQRDWETAVSHYNNALQIKIDFNDRYAQAATYHQLGMVAEKQRDWETAVSHYHNALQIKIDFNDRYAQAGTYGQLGLLAEAQENWSEAMNHLLQALEIFVVFQDSHSRDIALRGLARVWQAAVAQDGAFAAQSPAPARLAEILGVSVAEALEILKDEG